MAHAPIPVTFLPSDRTVRVPTGTSLLAAAREAGLPIAAACDGVGACGRCVAQIVRGEDALSAPTERERESLARLARAPNERLACQGRVRGPVAVTTTYW